MSEGNDLVRAFYTSFQQKNIHGMQACYHPDVEFSDEVFPLLKGMRAHAMWHMLLNGAGDAGLEITFRNIRATAHEGSCDWEAIYTFSATGRRVHNRVHASFRFKDGLIVHHTDRFNFWRWSQMAFGLKGALLGWTPFFKKKVRQAVAHRLDKFMARHVQQEQS